MMAGGDHEYVRLTNRGRLGKHYRGGGWPGGLQPESLRLGSSGTCTQGCCKSSDAVGRSVASYLQGGSEGAKTDMRCGSCLVIGTRCWTAVVMKLCVYVCVCEERKKEGDNR
jgi:hypothetical protein